jgi:hypothetical protein
MLNVNNYKDVNGTNTENIYLKFNRVWLSLMKIIHME